MQTITVEEIGNFALSQIVKPGDVIGLHRYTGSQVDWYITGSGDVGVAWYGGDSGDMVRLSDLDIIVGEEYIVTN